MAGGADVALSLVLQGVGAAVGYKVLSLLVEDAYRGIKRRLLRLLQRANQISPERPWGIAVEVGAATFYSGSTKRRGCPAYQVEALRDLLESMPDDLVYELPAEPFAGWYWDDQAGHWRLTPGVAALLQAKEQARRRVTGSSAIQGPTALRIVPLPRVSEDANLYFPANDVVRLHFESAGLIQAAGIGTGGVPVDEGAYLAAVNPVADVVATNVEVRVAPAWADWGAGGPGVPEVLTTFIDIASRGADLVALFAAARVTLGWLRENGVFGPAYVDPKGIELLARWELGSRGFREGSQLLSTTLIRIEGKEGEEGRYEGFAVVFRLGDGRLATLHFGLVGGLVGFSVEPADGLAPPGV
jgi:hypothetical protein